MCIVVTVTSREIERIILNSIELSNLVIPN